MLYKSLYLFSFEPLGVCQKRNGQNGSIKMISFTAKKTKIKPKTDKEKS